jgi:NADH dehydrogenase
MKHIVIVGGGFAGVKAARELDNDGRFQVTLISNRECFEYHAALYRSATGRSHLEVAVPLEEIFDESNVDVVLDSVEKIDAKKQVITTASKEKYHYDELVLAPGSVTAYFGISGLPEYSYDIKTIDGALELKEHLHAELTSGHKPDLNYVVVGGGPTGVELAGELVSYLKLLRKNHKINKPFHIDLVEAAPRILPTLPERYSRIVERRLKSLGVRIYTSTAVKGETADTLQLPEGSIDTHTVVWTAGMTNAPLFGNQGKLFELGKGHKATVDEYLGAGDNIWVLGDSAATAKSGLAQTAVHDGKFLAQNLIRSENGRPLKKYQPIDPVAAVPVGPNWCAFQGGGLQFYGYAGWVLRRWSDLQLLIDVLPPRLALRSWIMGTRQEESCSTCRKQPSIFA